MIFWVLIFFSIYLTSVFLYCDIRVDRIINSKNEFLNVLSSSLCDNNDDESDNYCLRSCDKWPTDVWQKVGGGVWEGSKIFVNFSRHLRAMIDSRPSYFCCRPTRRSVKNFTRGKNTHTLPHRRLLKRPVEWQTDVRPLNGYTGHLPLLLLICAFSLVFWRNTFFVQSHSTLLSWPGIKNEGESLCFFCSHYGSLTKLNTSFI